jgi:transposase
MAAWIRQDEADRGQRHDRPTTDMAEENRRLKRVNEVLRAASAYFAVEMCATRRCVDRGAVRDRSRQAVAAA